MTDALVWLVVLGLIALMFWALVRDRERLKNRTAAEYERDLAESRNSMLRAGMLELDKFLVNEKEKRAAATNAARSASSTCNASASRVTVLG